MKGFILAIALATTINGFGATTTPSTIQTTTVTNDSKILLGVDLRPSSKLTAQDERNYFTEDNAIAGFQFDKQTWIYYRQDFSTNLSAPNDTKVNGTELKAGDGSLRGGIKKLFQEGNWSLDYEGRAYFPTSAFSSDLGMITQIRNYAYINYALNEGLILYVAESPTFHIYGDGITPNLPKPNLENRTYLGTLWFPAKDLTVSVPLKMSNLRKTLNGESQWGHSVWLNPEVFYRINPNLQLGVGFESVSFVESDFGGFSIGNAFQYGKSQLILQANL